MRVGRTTGTLAMAIAALGFSASIASAGATITNGTIAIGVNDEGHLNTADGNVALNSGRTGVAYNFPGDGYRDATSPGCYCEGWGVAVNGSTSGYANVDSDGGAHNLTVLSFSATATTATSEVEFTSLPGLTVTHHYAPSASENLYEVTVTITNETGADVSDVTYRRVMDWDVPYTEFSEFVTIQGSLQGNNVQTDNNGFATANPLGSFASYGQHNVDFVDVGPTDHGALFDFNFGTLADGASQVFTIFYGAAGSERGALAALATVGAEAIYSFGQSSPPSGDPAAGTPATFIFGFKGVGAPPVPTPEPASFLLLGAGLAGLAFRRYRRA